MLKSRYLLRFDDICPTMNWDIWQQVETILINHNIRPIVAVIPDNQDDELKLFPPVIDFWERVRRWQSLGWTMALHGFQHKYISSDETTFLPISQRTEFVGLTETEQKEKLAQAMTYFTGENIVPKVWVAPWNSYDITTLKLLPDFGLTTVSDGLFLYPQTDKSGLFWLPQQLNNFRSFPFGVFTICYHINEWNSFDLAAFAENITWYKTKITNLDEVSMLYKNRRAMASVSTLQNIGNTFLRLKKSLQLRKRISKISDLK